MIWARMDPQRIAEIKQMAPAQAAQALRDLLGDRVAQELSTPVGKVTVDLSTAFVAQLRELLGRASGEPSGHMSDEAVIWHVLAVGHTELQARAARR